MTEYLKVGVSGVRGVVGESITPQIVTSFARAFGSFVGHGPVLVGRDTRPTGPMLEHAVIAGLQSVGCKPILVGEIPTPTVLVLTKKMGLRGAIIITASHNPSQWNALKFIDETGAFLSPARCEELYDIYHQRDYELVEETQIQPVAIKEHPTRAHFQKVFDYIDVEAIRKCKFKVAADCCNGVGAHHTRPFLEALGCEVYTCLDTPSGAFERGAEPIPANLGVLCNLIKEKKCDIGFAQDPDADRLAIVDENSVPIGEDLTVAFAVRQVLDHHEQGPVAIHLSTSQSIVDVAEARGQKVTRSKIGEVNVAKAMTEIGGVVGGEGNGGAMIPAIHTCRDSYASMAIVLELMAMEGKSVSEIRAEIPTYFMVKDKVQIRGDEAFAVIREMRHRYEGQKMNLLDGVMVELEDKWFHVRPSNTEPIIRVVTEAPTQEAASELAASIKAEIIELASAL